MQGIWLCQNIHVGLVAALTQQHPLTRSAFLWTPETLGTLAGFPDQCIFMFKESRVLSSTPPYAGNAVLGFTLFMTQTQEGWLLYRCLDIYFFYQYLKILIQQLVNVNMVQ